MPNYDVIVAGSGPAGATTAHRLAKAGLSVLILEKDELPRYKPCGGGISLKINRILDIDIKDFVEATVSGAYFSYGQKESTLLMSEQPVAYMVMRDKLDAHITYEAVKAGASLLTGKKVEGIAAAKDGYEVFTKNEVFTCRYVVGADGVNGAARRFMYPNTIRTIAASIEAEIEVEQSVIDKHSNYVHIDFGVIPYGYAWVFPKKNMLSVGIAGFKGVVKRPKDFFDKFIKGHDTLSGITGFKYKGYPLPLFRKQQVLTKGGVILTGDAGNLVDPFFGEGIYYAIRSAQLASSVIYDSIRNGSSDLGRYDKLLSNEFYPEFRAAQKVSLFVYSCPRIWYDILTERPELAEKYFNVLRGNNSYENFLKELKSIGGSLVKTAIKKSIVRLFN
ncbi:MAG: geranylgeranyl reductase family protein [Nitrospirae bacterium]|nr:geranylgeranyl reductase family protein [Nitrospirota bacterium]